MNSGYECKLPNPTSSVVVSGSSLTADELNDLIQTFIDNTIRVSDLYNLCIGMFKNSSSCYNMFQLLFTAFFLLIMHVYLFCIRQ